MAQDRLAVAIVIPLILLVSFISLGFTVWAPRLSLSGTSSIAPGGTLVLHGRSFLPGSSITLTLDKGVPVYFSKRDIPSQMAHSASASTEVALADVTSFALASGARNVVAARGDGSFTVTILVNPGWPLGKHTIHAIESLSHRSASLDFTISQNGATASNTPTTSPSPTGTGRPGVGGLSCINPGTLNLGPVLEDSTQLISGKVTLCTTGTGTIKWSATTNSTPWLQLDRTSCQVAAPGQVQVTVSASAASLKAGTYKATITFTGQPGNNTQTLNVFFTVSSTPPCVTASPRSLNFSSVAGLSDPPGLQTIHITNCGRMAGTWSATIAVGSGGNWLHISSTGASLAAGASTAILATASNLKAKLAAGNYADTIPISIGASTFSVSITLNVQAPPMLSVSPSSINTVLQCQLSSTNNQWICFVTLANSSKTLSLPWTASASGLSGVTITPGSSGSSVLPGQTEQVQMVGTTICEGTVVFTFQGPANSATVTLACSAPG